MSGATRRRVVTGAVGLAAISLAGSLLPGANVGAAETPSLAEIMKPGELPDIVVGRADARVTIVEYASMTCSHCADFHKRTFPALKAKYVETGQVRFILRELPWDRLAAAASMLARCSGDRAAEVVSVLFEQQEQWAVPNKPQIRLFEIAKGLGFSQEAFDKCLGDQALFDKIAAGRRRALETLQVDSTPTFFINGVKVEGALPIEEFDKVIEPMLKG